MSEQVFQRRVELPVPAAEAFAWHERPGALERLLPPWESVEIEFHEGIRDGDRAQLVSRLGPLRLRWTAEHFGYQAGREFHDRQASSPFVRWEHAHRFLPAGEDRCVLDDRIVYRVPLGAAGQLLAGRYVRRLIERMFEYRHPTLLADLQCHHRYADEAPAEQRRPLEIAVSGSRGLIGGTLVPLLTTGGHRVRRLVRSRAHETDVLWDPQSQSFDARALEGMDAVVHLAGENISNRRWTAAVKRQIRESRVHGTRLLCEALARLKNPPKTVATASAIGFYGGRGDQWLNEDSSPGEGFLAEVTQAWEAATQPARDAGIRVVCLRFGVVLSPRGGALAKMLPPFKFGGGGRVGSGRQFWSWISIDDVAGAIYHALRTQDLCGAVNLVAPHPVASQEFARTLGRVLRRPSIVPLPAWTAKLMLGEMADELLLASTRVEPRRLLDSGYEFRHPSLEQALKHMLGR